MAIGVKFDVNVKIRGWRSCFCLSQDLWSILI